MFVRREPSPRLSFGEELCETLKDPRGSEGSLSRDKDVAPRKANRMWLSNRGAVSLRKGSDVLIKHRSSSSSTSRYVCYLPLRSVFF